MFCVYFAYCTPPYNPKIWRPACWDNGEASDHCPIHAYLRINLRKLRPIDGNYYDLIRVPHGHIPVTKANLWSRLPLPVKEYRGERFYRCPSCGAPSFFKIDLCEDCYAWEDWPFIEHVTRKNERHDYYRRFWKRIEYLLLPVLVLVGQAWYVLASSRISPRVKVIRNFRRG